MSWNWELPNWPNFNFDPVPILSCERQFLVSMGRSFAYLEAVNKQEYYHFIVEILSLEGQESARIEGETLDRESLQSSIKRHFGLQTTVKRGFDKEARMAEMLCSVYETFDQRLTHEMLWRWHEILFEDSSKIADSGKYRTHAEPMQIVSTRYNSLRVFFEAPPSSQVYQEMEAFIHWFNSPHDSTSILVKSAIAHVYFESIHPFEDGNGRIGRMLAEKVLSQGVGQPVLIAISRMLEKRKKEYYQALEKCNRTLDIQDWIEFFAQIVLQALEESKCLLYFIMEKSKMLNNLTGQINPRQTKVLLRMFEEGPQGFKGGLSAKNYISITKTTRATATRDLTDLVEKGALVKMGDLRYTRYYLNLSRDN